MSKARARPPRARADPSGPLTGLTGAPAGVPYAPAMATLILLRHGQSEWNEKNLFTGWYDVDLTPTGEAEARAGGMLLADEGLLPDVCHTSVQLRAIRTAELGLAAAGRSCDTSSAMFGPERIATGRPRTSVERRSPVAGSSPFVRESTGTVPGRSAATPAYAALGTASTTSSAC